MNTGEPKPDTLPNSHQLSGEPPSNHCECNDTCSHTCHCGQENEQGCNCHGGRGCDCHPHSIDESNRAAELGDGDGDGDDNATIDESVWGETAPVVDEPAPDEIDELAAACIRFVHDSLGVELDFAPETLPLLDHYLIAARADLEEKTEVRELVLRAAGAYFGELLRRRINGFWLIPSKDVHTWRVCGKHVWLAVNPVGVVAEAVACSEDSLGPSGELRLARPDQADIAQRLANVPELPEDQYYLTSTRLEVIDMVVEHLRARMEQNDQADMVFDPDDYATDLLPYGRA